MTAPTDFISGHLREGGHAPGGVRDSDDVRVRQSRLTQTYAAFAGLSQATPEETAAVVQVLGLYGHAVDNGDLELLDAVLAPDVERPAVATPQHPLPAHHTVNTQVKRDGGHAVAWSRLVTVAGDGSVATADAVDVLAATPAGWRVTQRTLHPRHGGSPAIADGSTPW